MTTEQTVPQEPEGLDSPSDMGAYPLDSMMIRTETRTIHDVVVRRIKKGFYIMDPEFQRDFVWDDKRQSRLIESVLMRIPLPVFYLAENADGKLVVVDGLQRLTTFQRFLQGELRLHLDSNPPLNGKAFDDLPPKLQNRIEDTQLTLYLIDSKAPDRARLDIFERVNGGMVLTRQQMRNALYQGKATRFLKDLATHPLFAEATGGSLDPKTMRDREAVNRFCAFYLLGPDNYPDDMDKFLGDALTRMNEMKDAELEALKDAFFRSMRNNLNVFGKHSFRKHERDQDSRKILNMSLFDVFSTGLARYDEGRVDRQKDKLHEAFFKLINQPEYVQDITYGTNDLKRVEGRFKATSRMLTGVLGAV